MADLSRNLIVLSDGTGNSASNAFKTNVWRLYQALNLRDGSQVAVFGDGVGTSTIKVLRVLGLALGIGVKRNVLNLYKFLCRNYNDGDRIWAFGFSRGAFTVRVLAGLIHHEGLVTFKSEEELSRNALAAYRAYRKRAFATKIPWVLVGRQLRDWVIAAWNKLASARSYDVIKEETFRHGRNRIDIHFLGVWDTVVAYGLPIDELTRAADQWIWPMKFRDNSLLPNVKYARHALSLDDERRTFFPIPWDEKSEAKLRAEDAEAIKPDRLRQVWFAGAHADVGGGYPDDGLSFVPLCWMIQEADAKGLNFESIVVDSYAAIASPTGRMYDPRAGFGAFWRYQPRNVELLMGAGIVPIVHGSVITRMTYGNDGYAPISLPERIDVLPPAGPAVAFEKKAATAALARVTAAAGQAPIAEDKKRIRFYTDLKKLAAAADGVDRTNRARLVHDTVWWRRLVYFVTLFLALMAGAYPVIQKYLQIHGVTEILNDQAGGPVGWALGLVKGFLPGFAEPWLAAIEDNPLAAALIILALLVSLGFSGVLQQRISDRSRAAWNIRSDIDGLYVDRLDVTGQRHALVTGTIVFTLFGLGVWKLAAPEYHWVAWAFFALGLVCLAARIYRIAFPPQPIVPEHPGALLGLARWLRSSRLAVKGYRWVAEIGAPFAFFLVVVVAFVVVAHRATFDLLSTAGNFCHSTLKDDGASAQEKLSPNPVFLTNEICQPTGLRLIEGRKYRIRMEMVDDWFDKNVRTDVGGFAADGLLFYITSPLKRWWSENWFQPVARFGELGNYEQVLRPAAPLPAVRFAVDCKWLEEKRAGRKFWEGFTDIASPATPEAMQDQFRCDKEKGRRPSRVLISDVTADATGELFLYVNDAVLTLPGLTDLLYRNNSGTATVTVTRILANPVIPPPDEEGKR